MAEFIYTPTPPPADLGPFVDYERTITGSDEVKIVPGYWEGIPQIWRLHNLRVELTTDGTVANRNIWCVHYLDLLNNRTMESARCAVIPASSTDYLEINSLVNQYGTFYTTTDVGSFSNLLFKAFECIRIFFASGQAGDVCVIRMQLEYMNRKYGMRDPYTPGKGG